MSVFTTDQLKGKLFNGLTIKEARLIGNMSGIVLIFKGSKNIAAHVLTLAEAINMVKPENHEKDLIGAYDD